MKALLYAPLVLQSIFILGDELIFHRKRGLPRWEVWGHPLDTLSVAVPFALAAHLPFSEERLWLFISLGVFSCLFVTKDEFIHSRVCTPFENWIHSILFILHPISFMAAALLWMLEDEQIFLKLQVTLVTGFMIYQVFYWGVVWKFLKTSRVK